MAPELNDDTFVMFAMKHYSNPGCRGVKDFNDDLKRLRYIKRLLGRYRVTGEIKERLILNHLVVFFNVFGVEGATRLLFFKIQPDLWPELKTFLVFLNFMPSLVPVQGGLHMPESEIPLDQNLVEILRKI